MANPQPVEAACGMEICNEYSESKSRSSVQQGSKRWGGMGSIRLSGEEAGRVVDEIECERAAEAGDDGGRRSLHGSARRDVNATTLDLSLPNDALIYSYSYPPGGDLTCTAPSPVSPLPSDIISPPTSDHPLLVPRGGGGGGELQQPQQQVNQEQCSRFLEYILALAYLALFGIVGVLIRYALQVLFGPDVANVTNNHSALYIDLPSNMVGSFFMGWVGVVFKSKISLLSEALAIGLSTGLMGSITTFSSWIQEMVNLTTRGDWVTGIVGLLLGMELTQMSLLLGVESANLVAYVRHQIKKKRPNLIWVPSSDHNHNHKYDFIMCMIVIGILWGGSLILSVFDFRSHHKTKLWIACLVGPFGVWIRWFLARLNGQGIGAQKHLKWLPVGTLLANLIATMLIAALSTINFVVKDENAKIVIDGFELGFVGCLSTVSTFVVEVRAMHQSNHPWRAYAYIIISVVPAFMLGTLIYSIPVWTKGYS